MLPSGRTLRLPGRVGPARYHPLLHGDPDISSTRGKVHHQIGIAVTTSIGLLALNVGLHEGAVERVGRREQQLVAASQDEQLLFQPDEHLRERSGGPRSRKGKPVEPSLRERVEEGDGHCTQHEHHQHGGARAGLWRRLVPGYSVGQSEKDQRFSRRALVIVYVSFLTWMQSLLNILPSSLKRIGTMKNSMPFLREIFYRDPCSTRTKKGNVHSGSISFDKVQFTYPGEKKPVLKDLTSVADKEKVAIVGRSGSGKTTLMKLLLQLYVQDSGAIEIDAQDVTTMDVRYLRKQVNYVNQRTVMSNERIIDNIMYGHSVPEDQVIRIMKQYDLMKVFEDIPGGVYAQAGIQGTNMSLGMQKVVIVLRGILRTYASTRLTSLSQGLDPATRQNHAPHPWVLQRTRPSSA